MSKTTRWDRISKRCPETKIDTTLLIEWRKVSGKEKLNGIICNNSKLGDYCGSDCKWDCWVEISRKRT